MILIPPTDPDIGWGFEISDDGDDCQFSAKVAAIRHEYGYKYTPTIEAAKSVYQELDPTWIDGFPDKDHLPTPALVEEAFRRLGFYLTTLTDKTIAGHQSSLVSGHIPTPWTWIWNGGQWFLHEMCLTSIKDGVLNFFDQQHGVVYSAYARYFFNGYGILTYAGQTYQVDKFDAASVPPTDGWTPDDVQHFIDWQGATWGTSYLLRNQRVGQTIRDAIITMKQALAIP